MQIDTVNKFLDGCRAYGMADSDLFVTVDLQEQQNKNTVNTITVHTILGKITPLSSPKLLSSSTPTSPPLPLPTSR